MRLVERRATSPNFFGAGRVCTGGSVRGCLLYNISRYGTHEKNSVLLDDCLAAVDSHVARHIFGEYMKNKTYLFDESTSDCLMSRQCHRTEWIAFDQSTHPRNKQHIFCQAV